MILEEFEKEMDDFQIRRFQRVLNHLREAGFSHIEIIEVITFFLSYHEDDLLRYATAIKSGHVFPRLGAQ